MPSSGISPALSHRKGNTWWRAENGCPCRRRGKQPCEQVGEGTCVFAGDGSKTICFMAWPRHYCPVSSIWRKVMREGTRSGVLAGLLAFGWPILCFASPATPALIAEVQTALDRGD